METLILIIGLLYLLCVNYGFNVPSFFLFFIGIICLIIFILSKFWKPILKASIGIIALLIILFFTISAIWLCKEFGVESLALFGLLILSAIGEVFMLIKNLVDKIPDFKDFFKGDKN